MPLGEFTQQQITGETETVDSEVVIETNGRVIRPVTELWAHMVDEFKLHVTDDALWTRHRDPANVSMTYVKVYDRAFDSYDLDGDEFVAGVFCGDIDSAVQDARKPSKDAVELRIDDRRTLVTIARDYPTATVEWTDRIANIDPGAVRKEPNRIDDRMEEMGEWKARVDVKALHTTFERTENTADHLVIREDGGRLITHAAGKKADETGPVTADDDDDDEDRRDDDDERRRETAADFGEVVEPTEEGGTEGAESIFSLDYLQTQVEGLKDAGVPQVVLTWGEEVPLQMAFEDTNDDGEPIMEGELYLAPRIPSDD